MTGKLQLLGSLHAFFIGGNTYPRLDPHRGPQRGPHFCVLVQHWKQGEGHRESDQLRNAMGRGIKDERCIRFVLQMSLPLEGQHVGDPFS